MTTFTREPRDIGLLQPAPDQPPELGVRALQVLAAVLIPAAISLNLSLPHNLTSGTLVVLLLTPLWLPSFVKVPAGALIALFGVAFLISGFMLDWVSSADHEITKKSALVIAITFATNIFSVGALYWASRAIGVHWMVGVYGFVWMLDSLAKPSSWGDNPWKYAFALPISLLLFSMVDRQRFTTVKIIAALFLGAVSIVYESRSIFAVFLLTALALGWQRLRSKEQREPSLTLFLSAAVGISATAYYVLTRLLISGALGTGLKDKSEAQVEASGSLLLGGRPEWTVTIRLFRERPWGFGFGTVPSPGDYELGRQGFASIHLSSQENYLKHYVFHETFSLHSIMADMWAAAGPVGLLFVALAIGVLLSSLARQLAYRTATATQIFLTSLALWNIGFSPYYSNLSEVMLALTVAIAVGVAPDRKKL